MNESANDAMTLLAAADPGRTLTPVGLAEQTALLERITATDPPPPHRFPARRVAFAGVGVAAVAAVATAGVVILPGHHGAATTSAYAVVRQADSVQVTVRFDELHDPAALNAELQGAGARTVVMAQSQPGQCHTGVTSDPAGSPKLNLNESGRDSGQQKADIDQAFAAAFPWITTGGTGHDAAGYELFTVHPDAIPAGDQLLVYYNLSRPVNPDGTPSTSEAASFAWLLVPQVPTCVPADGDMVLTKNGIRVK